MDGKRRRDRGGKRGLDAVVFFRALKGASGNGGGTGWEACNYTMLHVEGDNVCCNISGI